MTAATSSSTRPILTTAFLLAPPSPYPATPAPSPTVATSSASRDSLASLLASLASHPALKAGATRQQNEQPSSAQKEPQLARLDLGPGQAADSGLRLHHAWSMA